MILFSSQQGSSEPSSVPNPAEATRPLRVLFIIPGESTGASMNFARRQVDDLATQGLACRTYFLASRTAPGKLLAARREIRQAITEFKPDLVHAHFGTMTALLTVCSTRLPVIITYRGSDLNPSPSDPWLRSFLGRLFSHLASMRARRIVCVSEQLRRRLIWGRKRAIVLPSGVDLSRFTPRDRDEARAELGWDPAEKIVLFNAGKNPGAKRLDLAQAAVEEARQRIGELRFEVTEGNIDPDAIPTLMNAADCLLLTSDWEGSPNVVKEALSCNLPVVSLDVGDVRERMEGVSPSRIVARDPHALGAAVAEILTGGERSNGHEAIQAISLPNCSRRLIALYYDALGQRPSTE